MARLIVGVDLGGTNVRAALIDSRFRIVRRTTLRTKSFRNKEALINAIVDCVKDIAVEHGINRKYILGVGLGVPGPVDAAQGLVHFFPNIPGWRNVKLGTVLRRSLGLPVFLDNDANLMCRAEHRLGAARNCTNALCITLGTGVGGGLIIDKKLFSGSTFAAGEFGHTPINEKGPRCNCGGVACIETYIGNARLEKKARRIFGRAIALEDVTRMANQGNRRAREF